MILKFNDATGTHPITVIEAIYSRRSVRHFTDEIVDSELLTTLLNAAVQAPTAMHEEPCAFSVIQDQGLLHRISNEIKGAILTSRLDKSTFSQHAKKILQTKGFEVFYNASTLVLICSKFPGKFVEADCWLAAENLMLAAYSHGLGSCVIGFAVDILNTPEWKSELSIPEGVRVIAPIILGKPSTLTPKINRKSPEILSWKSLSLENA
jgi:nitroreductase